MRPELRRVYARGADLLGTDPSCAMIIGYLPLDGDPETVCMDFGPASVEGWLAELGVRQRLAGDEQSEPSGLTPLEAQVLAYLRARDGQPVERAALLRDVRGVGYRYARASSTMLNGVSAARRT